MPHYTVRVNHVAGLGQLQRALQRGIDLVAFGLHAAEHATEVELFLPGLLLHVAPAENAALDFAGAKAEFPRWTVHHALRDSIEAVSLLLDEARMVCAIWTLGAGPVSGDEWNVRIMDEGQKFQRKRFPDKLQFLEMEYDLLLPPLTDDVKSINRARNCVVHRRGVVGPRDVDSTNRLVVRWRRMEIRVKTQDGQLRVVTPQDAIVRRGETLTFAGVSAEKAFTLGESISFSVQEFSDITWTLLHFGRALTMSLEAFGRSKGVRFPEGMPDALKAAEPTGDDSTQR